MSEDKRTPSPEGGRGSLNLGNLVDLGNQSKQPSLNLFVGKLLDALLLRDLQFLLRIDVALVRIAERVLEQELRTLGGATVLVQPLRSIRFDALKRIIDGKFILDQLIVLGVVVEQHLCSHAEKQAQSRHGVVLLLLVARLEILPDAALEQRRPRERFLMVCALKLLPLCANFERNSILS